jgi:DNA-binding CsgD family transcriptional regulator
MTTTDDIHAFTEREFQVIFRMCAGLRNEEIADGYRINVEIVQHAMMNIFDKAGVSTRMELLVFVMDALNAELRRRRLSMGDSGAAMEG